MSIAILVVLLGLMYLVLIVPRQRELRRHNQLMASIAVGDEVMTGAGVYGTITAIDGDYALLRVADDVELTIAKKSIASLVTDPHALTTVTDDANHPDEIGDDRDVELPTADQVADDNEEADASNSSDGDADSGDADSGDATVA